MPRQCIVSYLGAVLQAVVVPAQHLLALLPCAVYRHQCAYTSNGHTLSTPPHGHALSMPPHGLYHHYLSVKLFPMLLIPPAHHGMPPMACLPWHAHHGMPLCPDTFGVPCCSTCIEPSRCASLEFHNSSQDSGTPAILSYSIMPPPPGPPPHTGPAES